MKFRSLQCLCEIVACDFNFSRAAKRLFSTQPSVTRQIQLLEGDLGFEVLIRRGNRVTGLTPQGMAVYERACTILHEVKQLNLLGMEMQNQESGKLVVATTHVHARYTLLPSIKKFRVSHPNVAISIISGDPNSIAQTVASGQADFGLSAEAMESHVELASFPCYQTRRLIIVPKAHPLTRVKTLSLRALAKYPLIVYDRRFSSGWRVMKAFEDANITPNVVLTAIDAEVLKAYVAAGLGVAVIQDLAYDPERDHDIDAIDAGQLFECPLSMIALRKNAFLRGFTLQFLKTLMSPENFEPVRAAFDANSFSTIHKP
jgi:LysR family cys regulon transcriptional activator